MYNRGMFYVYLIESKKLDVVYVGQTDDLRRRFEQHKTGRSRYTSQTDDWRILYYEAYTSRSLAMKRERQLKRKAKGYHELLKRVRDV